MQVLQEHYTRSGNGFICLTALYVQMTAAVHCSYHYTVNTHYDYYDLIMEKIIALQRQSLQIKCTLIDVVILRVTSIYHRNWLSIR